MMVKPSPHTPYSMRLIFLNNGCEGTVTVTNNDGTSQDIAADDFAELYVIIDFMSDAPPVLYNPDTGTELTDFLLAVTEEGEAIYSVVSSVTYNATDMIENAGWDVSKTYRYVATDQFYVTVIPEGKRNRRNPRHIIRRRQWIFSRSSGRKRQDQ